ncbi:MAG: NUMOD4 domain-containing protein [Lacticaseibacillus paracasei]
MFNDNYEEWKDITGFEGAFQVSSLGRVRSLPRIDALGHHRAGIIRKAGSVHDGYLQIALEHNNKKSVYLVHRLVAEAFLPNPHGYPTVNHKNENPSDNRVENLEWCTSLYNNMYNGRNKRVAKALERPVNVITSSGHHYFFSSQKLASEILGLDDGHVSECVRGKLKHHHGFSFEQASEAYV